MIYLDNCATTQPRKEVVEVMVKALTENFANPSSLHSLGFSVEKEINMARSNVANIINADDSEIYFTSGGTEGNNIAINGFVNKNKKLGNKIITTSIEHSSILDKIRSYQDFNVVEVGVDRYANLNLDNLYREIDDKTILLTLAHVNNEIGTINDVEKIIKKAKSINKNILIHIDGVQAFGKITIDVKKINCDSYSLSGHKIYGPKGIGALYIKSNTRINPLVIGGGQEKGLRSGTENVPGILGLGKAAEYVEKEFINEYNHAVEIKDYLKKKINEELEDFEINSPKNSSPYILSLSIRNIRAEVLLHYLEQDEIYISTASACSSHGTKKSHVLDQMGIENSLMEGTIRICTSKDISKEDIDIFISKLSIYVEEIRKIMKR
ncbi:cysteine desulfurase family protein [Anaerosphaera multitolerans]|uniref:Cysteine desulfurase n=1 Tax=Anaerosphaera multitolerans TaxID=2487351 RepID=A0A437S757_9FIRM|nr:cysteine desulfurase family protein [Anaerosphaera multitolerans]RVU54880.1 cysteine desulfurase [Anaerosphaera multitolerans]